MKPMQKLTRYPLLFKRLLPNLRSDSPNYYALSNLISEIEGEICNVNETVRRMGAKFRIKFINHTLDFGMVTEKFRIETEDRELILENTLQYQGKTGMPLEVIVLLFNDLILITRRSKKTQGGYLLYKSPIPLEEVAFLDQVDSEGIF